MRLQILGCGAAVPDGARFGSAFVVEWMGSRILFDCGPATTFKMAKVGIAPTSIDHVFFTHHHFDHDVDYPCFLLSRWDQSIGREGMLEVFGPAPTEQLTRRLLDADEGAFAHDWIARSNHPMSLHAHQRRGGTLPRRPPDVRSQDLRPNQTVERSDWSVQTMEAAHAQPWLDSLAYRLTTPEGSIVFTGDTGPSGAVAQLAAGADTLVMSCINFQEALDGTPVAASVAGTLTAADLARQADVKRLVLVHQYPHLAEPGHRERAIAEVATRFDGDIIFGDELMALEL